MHFKFELAVAYLCGNCHTAWDGGGVGYSSRLDFIIYNGLATAAIPTTNTMYLMDSDQDGRTNLEEIQMSQSTTRPAQTAASPNINNNWNWQIPDVDGDGCSSYFSRFTEAGVHAGIQVPSSGVARASIVGTGNNYRRYNPIGWDIDDNDASQGCSAAWTPSLIVIAPGTSTDYTNPGKINTLSGAALASGVIPLKWVPVGDDGNGLPGDQTGGKAHSYEIRYTTAAFANGTIGRNPRSPADWEVMHNIAEPDEIDSGGFWSSPGDPDSLMQALYEPRPDVPNGTAIQTCNARNTTCTAGASYDIKARGTSLVVNAITNLQTYWIAMWTHDGVTRVTGNLTTPGTVTEQATLSNIIAVTAGGGGAAISSISPTTLSAPGTVTVSGYGLHAAGGNAAQMVLTNTAGTVVAAATITASPATATLGNLVGNFATLPAMGTYNLEVRTLAGVMKAAWVEAVTISSGHRITSPLTATGQVGTPFSYQITSTNSPTSYGASPLPAGSPAFAVSATGLISGTPTTAGTTYTTVTATYGGGTVSAVVAITINPAPPTIDACSPTTPPLSGQVGVPYSFTCTATGGTTPYTWSATGLPTSLSINSSTGVISGTPSAAGTFGATITVTGGGTSSVATTIVIAKGNQTVTLSCPGTLPVSGNGSCSATSSVGLTPFTYAASGDCTVNSTTGAVTAAAAATTGTCSVTANQWGNATYNPAISAPSSIAITNLNQTVIVTCPSTLSVNGTGTCSASSTSGLTTFTYAATGACTINSTSGAVTAAPTSGSCSVTAAQAGNTTYYPAISAPVIIMISPPPPLMVTLVCPASLPVSGTGSCSATSPTGLTTFTYAAIGDCTVNSYTGAVTAATAVTTGFCSVTATQPGDATYASATSAPFSIAITKLNQTVNLNCPSTLSVSGMGICSATSTSGLTTFTFSATGACTINSTSGAATAAATAGTCSVTATQAGNATYNPATSAPSSIVIAFGDPFYTVTATAGVGGTITPASQVVFSGSAATFTVEANIIVSITGTWGYTIESVTDTCGPNGSSSGSLVGNAYTTGAISVDCAVTASFAPIDTTTPVITADPLGRSTPPFIGPLTVTLSSNEPNTTVFYTLNGGTPTTSSLSCAAPCTLTITKTTLLQYIGRDAAGNLSPSYYQTYPIAAVDLIMSQVSKTATSVKKGLTFAITNTERNNGTLAMRTASNQVSFYLSADNSMATTPNIKLAGERTIFKLAAKTNSTTAATTVTVPSTTAAGVYFVFACADRSSTLIKNNVESESSESNNCKVAGSSSIAGSQTIKITN